MPGHLEIPQGGGKQLRQLSWREAYRGAEAARALAEQAAPADGVAKSPRSRLARPATKADGTAGDDAAASSPCSYESSDNSSRPPTTQTMFPTKNHDFRVNFLPPAAMPVAAPRGV